MDISIHAHIKQYITEIKYHSNEYIYWICVTSGPCKNTFFLGGAEMSVVYIIASLQADAGTANHIPACRLTLAQPITSQPAG